MPSGETSVSNSTDTNRSGESGAANKRFHSGLEFSNAVRAPYAAMSSRSISMTTFPVSGPGTVLLKSRNDLGMTGLLNFRAAACASFAMKSPTRPRLYFIDELSDYRHEFPLTTSNAAVHVRRAQRCGVAWNLFPFVYGLKPTTRWAR